MQATATLDRDGNHILLTIRNGKKIVESKRFSILDDNPNATQEEVEEWISGFRMELSIECLRQGLHLDAGRFENNLPETEADKLLKMLISA